MKFSGIALFHMKTRVFLIYFVYDWSSVVTMIMCLFAGWYLAQNQFKYRSFIVAIVVLSWTTLPFAPGWKQQLWWNIAFDLSNPINLQIKLIPFSCKHRKISLNLKVLFLHKQPKDVFYKKSCSWQFRNIHRKTTVLESLFNTIAGLQTYYEEFLRNATFVFSITFPHN